jgi:DNA (cytosine-5)-methyltransferase 1
MKYISLFAGVGGFDLALNKLGHECVYANDFDKYCKIIYDKNFKHKLDCRSLTEVRADELPDFDLLVGGFPCQSFSIAGKRGGFDDTRGTLFFDIARIVKAKRPKYIILENVKGLLSHDSGRTFKTILSTLTELHYDIQTMVLNSKNFGVPQNRERVFIVGHLRGEPRPKVFPIGEISQGISEQEGGFVGRFRTLKKQGISPTLTARYWKQSATDPYINSLEEVKETESMTLVEFQQPLQVKLEDLEQKQDYTKSEKL